MCVDTDQLLIISAVVSVGNALMHVALMDLRDSDDQGD
jgi:hypothetical protein